MLDNVMHARTREEVPSSMHWLFGINSKRDVLPTFTLHMGTLLIASAFTVIMLFWVGRRMTTPESPDRHRRYMPRGRLAQLVEMVVVYLRDEMLVPILGKDHTRRYLPFLLTLFFFILLNNLIGLVPLLDVQHLIGGLTRGDWHWAVIGGTATGNIAVTAGLATIAFIVIQVHGLRDLGIGGWLHHLLGGAPWYLAPLMIPIEIAGMIIKPCALAIRLFANMLAGHTLMSTVLLFGFMALNAGLGWAMGGTIGVVSAGFAIILFGLELFVALLQAFVFMFLTAVFIAQLSHHDDEHDEHEQAHGHGPEDAHSHNGGSPAAAH
ncbi:MAG: F0F1 ATP synthase subunit A [Phycisphaerales bacterium]